MTALMHCSRNKFAPCAKLLLEAGADTEVHSNEGVRYARSYPFARSGAEATEVRLVKVRILFKALFHVSSYSRILHWMRLKMRFQAL